MMNRKAADAMMNGRPIKIIMRSPIPIK